MLFFKENLSLSSGSLKSILFLFTSKKPQKESGLSVRLDTRIKRSGGIIIVPQMSFYTQLIGHNYYGVT